MVKMRYLFLSFLFVLSCQSTSKIKKSNPNSAVALNGSLSIVGKNVVNEKGKIVSFAGNSLFWSNDYYKGHSFYNKEVLTWLQKDWKSDIIRIPMAADPTVQDSYIYDKKQNVDKVDKMVKAAIELGMYVIIDWHSQHAEENEAQAIEFFEMMAKKYGKHPNVIYEIYNEPLKISWDNVLKPYAEHVIAAIRKIDPDNIIVVGTPHWSQDVDVVAKNPIKGYKNIAYTLHFYAGSHLDWLLNKAQKAIDNNLPIIVTEWGTVNANGGGSVNYEFTEKWMKFCKANNLTHCNWSVHDKDEGASILESGANVNGGWKEENLSPSGKLVRGIIQNWRK